MCPLPPEALLQAEAEAARASEAAARPWSVWVFGDPENQRMQQKMAELVGF